MSQSRSLSTKLANSACLVLVLLASPATARADAGIPMLPFAYPVVLLFLIPIIGIEAWYIRTRLRTPWSNTLAATAKANLITLVFGFPLMWLICFGMELLFWLSASSSKVLDHFLDRPTAATEAIATMLSAAWLGPTNDVWAIPTAFVALLAPSFFLSGWIESKIIGRYKWLRYEGDSSRVVWQANILSYVFLAAAGFVGLRVGLNALETILFRLGL